VENFCEIRFIFLFISYPQGI